jgi:predicted NBD/HSP70 family sugar kinase
VDDRQGASNRTPRQINRQLIFNQIRTRQPISRAELARISGLQRSTISNIVEELLNDDWVVEAATGEGSRGRKPTYLAVDTRKAVIAVDVHPTQTTVALADLTGGISAETQVALPSDPDAVMTAIIHAIRQIMKSHPESSFQGVGITVPGRFSRRLEQAIFAPNIPWPIAQIKLHVEHATGLPVVVENVANACALSEVWFGYSDATRDVVVVNVSEGIGTGIYANGRLLRGNGDAAGEFGHVQVDSDGLPCGCGSHGCWETIASNRAAMRYYREIKGKPAQTFDALVKMANRNEPDASAAIKKTGKALARGMHMIISALAPAEIVVVGELTRAGASIFPIIDAELRNYPIIEMPAIRASTDPDRARLRSAVALIMNEHNLAFRSDHSLHFQT